MLFFEKMTSHEHGENDAGLAQAHDVAGIYMGQIPSAWNKAEISTRAMARALMVYLQMLL